MKRLYTFLSVLTLCILMIGCVSASSGFSVVSETQNPSSEVLQVGDTISATLILDLPSDEQRAAEYFKFNSDLDKTAWKVVVLIANREATYLTRSGSGAEIYGQYINYPYEITLRIEMTGVVSNASAGKDICIMNIQQIRSKTIISEYSAPSQYVYNTANFSSDVAARKSAVSQMQTTVSSYTGTGVATSDAQTYVNQGSAAVNNAEKTGTANITASLAYLNNADTAVANAQEALNYAILEFVANQIAAIQNDVNTLNAMGVNDKATLISVSANSLTLMYNTAVDAFKEGKIQDLSALYNSAISTKAISENYIATSSPVTSTPTPVQTSVVQPTQTSVVQPTQTYYTPTTTNPTQPQATAVALDSFTKILLIVIIILAAGLVITVLLLKNAKKHKKDDEKRRGKDRWESL